MLRHVQLILVTLATTLFASQSALADNHSIWNLDTDVSKVAYASIKKNSVGEVNHFTGLTGGVSKTGDVNVDISLDSVETFIAIRNTRMVDFVFGGKDSKAKLSANIDVSALESIQEGAVNTMNISGTLVFGANTVPIETSVVVTKLGKDRLMVVTDEMIMVKTQDLGVEAKIDKLMELASLPGITRVVPVTIRLVFNRSGTAPVKATSTTPETSGKAKLVAAGKNVYRQCQACHNATQELNTLGPHLVGIMNRPAGTVAGFNYSPALKDSGLTWSKENLAAFLSNPAKLVPGNRMPFPGMQNASDIESVIAYLESLN